MTPEEKLQKLSEWVNHQLKLLEIDDQFFKNNRMVKGKIVAYEEIKHRINNLLIAQ